VAKKTVSSQTQKTESELSSDRIAPQELSQILILSEQELVRLTKLAVLVRTTEKRNGRQRIVYDWRDNVRRYIQHLRRPAEAARDDYQTEKKLTQQIAREMKAHELAVLRGDMIKRARVVFVMTNLLGSVKNKVLALPGRVARRLVGQRDPNKVRQILDHECRQMLREASKFGAHSFDEIHKNGAHSDDDDVRSRRAAKRRRKES